MMEKLCSGGKKWVTGSEIAAAGNGKKTLASAQLCSILLMLVVRLCLCLMLAKFTIH